MGKQLWLDFHQVECLTWNSNLKLTPFLGEALHRHLPKILPALIGALAEDSAETELELAEAVVLSVSDDDSDIGVSCIMEELSTASMFKRDDHNRPKNDEVI